MDSGRDRLSELPESLIHHIMSFLSAKECAKFATLSQWLWSAHLSFPSSLVFEFCDRFKNTHHEEDVFLNFVHTSVEQHRTSESKFGRLSFNMSLSSPWSGLMVRLNSVTDLLQNLIDFAMHKEIPYLNLECHCAYLEAWGFRKLSVEGPLKRLPDNGLFSAETIKSLRLCGVLLGPEDLILACPLIEDFRLSKCHGLKSIHVSSSAKLIKKITIDHCVGLERIHISSHKCLEFLELRRAEITDQWIRNHVSEFESLETLKLIECENIKNMRVHNENLKCLELEDCNALENVDVLGSGLESFQLLETVRTFHYEMRSRVNVNCCKFLKNLVLSNSRLTEKWIEDSLSGSTYLENLEFHDCDFTLNNPVKIYLGNLKSMKFTCNSSTLHSIEIESPNLVSLSYSGKLMPSPVVVPISSNLKEARICLKDLNARDRGFHKKLRDFLSCFAHSETVLLYNLHDHLEDLIYPEQVRKTLIPPLHGVKHLKILARTLAPERIMEFVDSLLWLSPRPKSISFLGTVGRQKTIAFHYGVPANSQVKEEEDNDLSICCPLSPVRCWRDDLTAVAIDGNFEDGVKTSLWWYFLGNTKGRIKIYLKNLATF